MEINEFYRKYDFIKDTLRANNIEVLESFTKMSTRQVSKMKVSIGEKEVEVTYTVIINGPRVEQEALSFDGVGMKRSEYYATHVYGDNPLFQKVYDGLNTIKIAEELFEF